MSFENWMPSRPFLVPQWGDDDFSFVAMELDQTSISQSIKFTNDFSCGGFRFPTEFRPAGEMSSFLLVEKAMASNLMFGEDMPGLNMCELAANVATCNAARAEWEPK